MNSVVDMSKQHSLHIVHLLKKVLSNGIGIVDGMRMVIRGVYFEVKCWLQILRSKLTIVP